MMEQTNSVHIHKTQSCPVPVSRWNVTKVHMKEKIVKTLSRSPSVAPKPCFNDNQPIVLVGPVIGLVTTTSARILLEIDRDATVTISLYKDTNAYPKRQGSIRGRGSGSFHNLLRAPSLLMETLYKSSGSDKHVNDDDVEAENSQNGVQELIDSSELDSEGSQTSTKQTTTSREGSGLKLFNKSRFSSLGRASTDITFQLKMHDLGNSGSNHSSTSISRKGSGPLKLFKTQRSSSLQRHQKRPIRYNSSSVKTYEEGTELRVECTKEMVAKRACVFVFNDLEPGTFYKVVVDNCHDYVEESRFRTFPLVPVENFHIASISCNSIFITKKTIPNLSDLWAHLAGLIPDKVDLIVHLGDQIYGDGDKQLDAGAGKNRDKWSNRFKIALEILKDLPKEQWSSKAEEIREKYREVYRDTWKHPPTAKCLATCPNLMIYDDHEIRDNWGDNEADWSSESKEFFVAHCAWIVTMEYQRQLYEDVDFHNLEAINKDHHFHVIGKVGLMFLDIRGSRTFHRLNGDPKPYLGSRQWEDIKKALGKDGLFDDVQVLVVCSPAPLVFLVPSITTILGRNIPKLEDFKGHWSIHKEEQTEMINCLEEWKKSGNNRDVIVLGGDVHCGGHSYILKNDKVLFYQLTTSAIANMPLPKTAYYFMRLIEQLEHIREEIKFWHFHWTRARNYGLVQIKLPKKEGETPEIIAQLVKGKFLLPVRMGRTVSNLHKDDYAACKPLSPAYRRTLMGILVKPCQMLSCYRPRETSM